MRINLQAIVFGGCMCLGGCTPSSSTTSLVYTNLFSKDTIVTLEKRPMIPAQINPRCILLNNGKILVRTSTQPNAIYSVFSYPAMKHLSYFGNQSEFVVPLEQSNDEFYLVRSDSLFFYKWAKGDSLKQTSNSFFHDIMGQQMLGVAKLSDNLYVYSNNWFNNGMDEFFMVDIERNLKKPKGAYPNMAMGFSSVSDFKSAYAHEVISKPDGNRMLIFYYRTRRCRIYNQKGTLLHDILLNYEPCQSVVDTDVKKRFLHIKDAFVTDNRIYLLCPDTREENSSCSLLIADWDGNFRVRYHLGHSISYFFVDESLNCFCGIDSNDFHHFYLLKLDENSS